MRFSARPSAPISSGERTGARSAESPSAIRRAMDCISTTGRVTRPATKRPMPAANARATRAPAAMIRYSAAKEAVTSDTGSARRSTALTRPASPTGMAT